MLGAARVSAHDVDVVGPFIEGLARCQGDFLAALDLHDDRPFQHVDEGVRIVTMNRVDRARRILDGDHLDFLAGVLRQRLRHERRDHGIQAVRGRSSEAAAGDDGSRHKVLENLTWRSPQ